MIEINKIKELQLGPTLKKKKKKKDLFKVGLITGSGKTVLYRSLELFCYQEFDFVLKSIY